jgi:hypothetical protein
LNKPTSTKKAYTNENAKIESAVIHILENANPKAIAKQHGATFENDKLTVYVHLVENQNKPKDVEVLAQDKNIVKSKLNLDQIKSLAKLDSIKMITLPEFAVFYDQQTSEGVEFSEADSMHAAGFNGTGIKIGVIDDSFIITNPEISNNWVSLWNGTSCANDISCGFVEGNSHGTAVAAIVVDMAPGAELYLYAIDDSVDFAGAIQHAIDNNVDILTASLGFPNSWGDVWYRDGTSRVAEWVDWAKGNGTLVTVAAGNQGDIHWKGNFDSNNKIPRSNFSELGGTGFASDLSTTFTWIDSVMIFNSSAVGSMKACLPVTNNFDSYTVL